MTTLDEVPGAGERPGNCPLTVSRDEAGTVTLTIPARGVSLIILFLCCITLGNLLVMLFTGMILLVAHRSVLFMAQISPGGLPVSLRPFDGWLLIALLLAEALGFWTLAAVLRPIFVRETLTFETEWLRVQRWEWGREKQWQIARADVRGFQVTRVPPGMDAGTLTLHTRGEPIEIGEYLREADRDWLASVGNALLRE